MTIDALHPDLHSLGHQALVNSFTEWDPLQEVVVGRLEGGVFPTWQESMTETMPNDVWNTFRQKGGSAFPSEHLQAAHGELDHLCEVLSNEGITVRRPDAAPHEKPFATPHWETSGGLYAGMPRDCLMVVGDAIVEAPMSWRCRYFETDAFRNLIKEYFQRGARWIPGPRPQLTDELYRESEADGRSDHGGGNWAVTEYEPVFDAADFMRFGRDLIVQRSHVTNNFGIEWVRRALAPDVRVHVVEVDDPHAMHIDATLAPLAPGKLLINPERYVHNPLFDGWDLLPAPAPTLPDDWPMYFCSPWVSMNVLSISPDTVVVESHEKPLIDALTAWGFRCVPVPFRHVYSFGGSFHCVTLDVSRTGGNSTYLSDVAGTHA
uniref:Amidinotransferase n=1 Tax=Streptomyces sp. NBC_00008 TaxID=2903610 RepID=A0AAU2VLY3_9ACTN